METSFKNILKKLANKLNCYVYLHRCYAKVAQLVELQPSKLVVASSSLVFRSKNLKRKFGVFYL
jgi:hypothetical protein